MDRERRRGLTARVVGAAGVARGIAGGASAAALVVAVVSSLVLLRRFWPDLQVEDLAAELEPRYGPRPWVGLHEVALGSAATAAVCWAVLTGMLTVMQSRSRGAAAALVLGAGVTVAGCLVAALTWHGVRWDQLGLWSVMVVSPSELRGLWVPAVSDEVRFLIVDGAEVGQGTYLRWLLIHLSAPVVALTGLVVTTWVAARQGTADTEAVSASR